MGLIAFDTMVGAHAINEERGGSGKGDSDRSSGLSLLNLGTTMLGVTNWGKGVQSFGDAKRPPTPLWGPDGMGTYCAHDVGITDLIYDEERRELSSRPDTVNLLKQLVLPGMTAVLHMELNGIWVDQERAHGRRSILRERAVEAGRKALNYACDEIQQRAVEEGVDALLGNDNFLKKWFFSEGPWGLGLTPVTVTAKRQDPQLNDHVLQVLAERSPAAKHVSEFKKATKHIQFIDQWFFWMDPQGRLHPHFNITGTVTGRRSCDRPNLQQVPRDKFIRSIIGAPLGWYLLEVDYSQIEVRLAAWFANEENMLRIYAEGGDIYIHTAAIIMDKAVGDVSKEDRRRAKAVVLGFLYGMGWKKFRLYAKEMYDADFTEDEAQLFRERFFAAYPGLVRWHERARLLVNKHLEIKSPIGRVRHLIRILSVNEFERGKAERQAINSPVQGMGGDLTLAGNQDLDLKLPRDKVLICGDVHDALLFQIRADEWRYWTRIILEAIERPAAVMRILQMEPPVRLKAEGKLGSHWGEPFKMSVNGGEPKDAEFSLDELDDLVLVDAA